MGNTLTSAGTLPAPAEEPDAWLSLDPATCRSYSLIWSEDSSSRRLCSIAAWMGRVDIPDPWAALATDPLRLCSTDDDYSDCTVMIAMKIRPCDLLAARSCREGILAAEKGGRDPSKRTPITQQWPCKWPCKQCKGPLLVCQRCASQREGA